MANKKKKPAGKKPKIKDIADALNKSKRGKIR
jgi:hypothetical protein